MFKQPWRCVCIFECPKLFTYINYMETMRCSRWLCFGYPRNYHQQFTAALLSLAFLEFLLPILAFSVYRLLASSTLLCKISKCLLRSMKNAWRFMNQCMNKIFSWWNNCGNNMLNNSRMYRTDMEIKSRKETLLKQYGTHVAKALEEPFLYSYKLTIYTWKPRNFESCHIFKKHVTCHEKSLKPWGFGHWFGYHELGDGCSGSCSSYGATQLRGFWWAWRWYKGQAEMVVVVVVVVVVRCNLRWIFGVQGCGVELFLCFVFGGVQWKEPVVELDGW